uniref:Uncharacterized protein n=1 Tax=Arundo donax TaxID=35708 RepID=A0A0A9CXA8_ARUDO
MFTLFIERCVNQRMPPAMKSSNESSVDAAIAMEPVLIVAYTLKTSSTILA